MRHKAPRAPGRFSVFWMLGLALLASAPAQAGFEDVLPGLSPTFTLTRIEAESAAFGGEVSSDMVREYGLLNYTQWSVSPDLGVLAVYEMMDTQGAFGLFTIWREINRGDARTLSLGVEHLWLDGRLAFWRGHYLFVLRPLSTESELLPSFPAAIKKAIDERNIHPVSVFQLPEENLIRSSIRFYVGQQGLASNPEVPRPLIPHLGFDSHAEATVAHYGPGGFPLLLLAYPTPSVADRYAGRIQDALQSVFSEDGIYMKRSGPLLGIFLGPEAAATEVLGNLHYTATVKWIQDEEARLRDLERERAEIVTFFGVVTRSIVFTGVFIVAVLVLGITAGLLRVLLIRRYPGMSQRDGPVFLDLRGPVN